MERRSVSVRVHHAQEPLVMVVLDQFTRRIIGCAAHAGDLDGIAVCRMFVQVRIVAGVPLPCDLSSDHDPLFEYHRWRANLRIVGVQEVKKRAVRACVASIRRAAHRHDPARVSRSCAVSKRARPRAKLSEFQRYFNAARAHASLNAIRKRGSRRVDVSARSARWLSLASALAWSLRAAGRRVIQEI